MQKTVSHNIVFPSLEVNSNVEILVDVAPLGQEHYGVVGLNAQQQPVRWSLYKPARPGAELRASF